MFPRDMICLRNMSVDTLHKGDTEDDDDDDNDNNNNNNNNNNNIHRKLAEVAELIEEKSPYTPANVLENDNFKLYWNRCILTDKTIPFNRPDIAFINKKTKNTFLIDTAVPNTHNLAKTINDKQKNTKNWRIKYVLCGSKTQLK